MKRYRICTCCADPLLSVRSELTRTRRGISFAALYTGGSGSTLVAAVTAWREMRCGIFMVILEACDNGTPLDCRVPTWSTLQQAERGILNFLPSCRSLRFRSTYIFCIITILQDSCVIIETKAFSILNTVYVESFVEDVMARAVFRNSSLDR